MYNLVFEQKRKYDLILLGRVAIDLNPLDYYKPLSESSTFRKYVGGSPANIAVGLSRLGGKVGFFSKVSDDAFGDYVINFFKAESIDTSHITRCTHGENLGLTFTEMLSEEKSSILMYRNDVADLSLSVDDIDEAYIKDSKALLISGTALSKSPSREAVLKAVLLAKKNNTKVILDLDYRAYSWSNKDEISIYYSIVAGLSDIILGSREEFDLTEGLLGKVRSDEDSAKYWHCKGVEIVIIKHGKDGSAAYVKDGSKYQIKPYPVKCLKSFGGGDGYASAFLHGIFMNWEIELCLKFGNASAAMLVASHACSKDMPTKEEIIEFIKEEEASLNYD